MTNKKIFILLIAVILCSATVNAQSTPTNKEKIAKQFDKITGRLQSIDISKPAEVKKVVTPPPASEEIFEQAKAAAMETLKKGKKEIEQKKQEYVPVESTRQQRIDADLLPLLAGMPEPVASLPQAKVAMRGKSEDNIYNKYIEKLKTFNEQLESEIRKEAATVPEMNEKTAKALAIKKAGKATADMNNNSVIQAMGGMEKLKNMSAEERKALAAKMAQNPMAYTNAEGDPKKLFTRKMMTDATYAAKYNNMNNAQKEEEYTAFLKENGFVNNEGQASVSKTNNERNEAATQIAIDKRLSTILEHMQQLASIVGSAQQNTESYFAEVNKKIADEYAKRVDALPLTEHGEAGKSKDTYPLDIAYNVIIYPVGEQEAIANKEVWRRYVEALKVTIAEYNEFLNEYWGKNKAVDKMLILRNQTPACILAGMCKQIIGLTGQAEFQTNQNAGKQRTYDEQVLHLYE